MSWLSIPAGPADLLDIALEVLGHVVVDNTTDVSFVQAHAESHRGHHHAQVAAHEVLLDAAPLRRGQAGVVRVSQPGGQEAPGWKEVGRKGGMGQKLGFWGGLGTFGALPGHFGLLLCYFGFLLDHFSSFGAVLGSF